MHLFAIIYLQQKCCCAVLAYVFQPSAGGWNSQRFLDIGTLGDCEASFIPLAGVSLSFSCRSNCQEAILKQCL